MAISVEHRDCGFLHKLGGFIHDVCEIITAGALKLIVQKSEYCIFDKHWTVNKKSLLGYGLYYFQIRHVDSRHFSCFSKVQSRRFINLFVSQEIVFTLPS